MADQTEPTPVWVWILGGVVILAVVIGILQILDWIFSWQLLLLAIIGAAAYFWYRGRQRTEV